MFKLDAWKRLRPLSIFFIAYTLIFFLWTRTFFYTLPFLAGLLIAAALQPVIAFAEKKLGWSRGLACGVSTALTFALLFAGLALLITFAVREITAFLVKTAEGGFPEFSPPVRQFLRKTGDFFQSFDLDFLQRNQEELMELLKNSMDLATALLSRVLGVITSLPTVITLVLTAALSTYFIARDFAPLRNWARGLLTENAARHLRSAAENSAGTGRRYMLSYILIYFISFCEAFVITSMLHVPYPLITALAVCVADVLPVLGPGFIFVPVAAYQLLTGFYGKAGGLLVGWLVMTCVRQVIEPKLVASTTKIHPLVMLAALYFSLVAGSFWVLLYVLGFFILHSLLRGTGALPPIHSSTE